MAKEIVSVFLKVDPKYRVFENELAFCLYDIHPISPGRILVIPKRQFSSMFDCRDDEWLAIFELIKKAKQLVTEKHKPDGFNLGVNVGPVAGQTVMHAHVHLIPRYKDKSLEDSEHVRNLMSP